MFYRDVILEEVLPLNELDMSSLWQKVKTILNKIKKWFISIFKKLKGYCVKLKNRVKSLIHRRAEIEEIAKDIVNTLDNENKKRIEVLLHGTISDIVKTFPNELPESFTMIKRDDIGDVNYYISMSNNNLSKLLSEKLNNADPDPSNNYMELTVGDFWNHIGIQVSDIENLITKEFFLKDVGYTFDSFMSLISDELRHLDRSINECNETVREFDDYILRYDNKLKQTEDNNRFLKGFSKTLINYYTTCKQIAQAYTSTYVKSMNCIANLEDSLNDLFDEYDDRKEEDFFTVEL